MDNRKISVIVPIYNVEKGLRGCLESLVAQTLKEIEIICVDDGSTDSSAEIVKEYAEKDSRVMLLQLKKNCGTSVARKEGVLKSSGQYVMFCDSDDRYLPDACEVVWNEMAQDSVDVLQFNTKVVITADASLDHKDLKKVLEPVYEKMEGDLCRECLVKKQWGHTLWNKAYNGDMCRKAFEKVAPIHIIVADDMYAMFLLLYYAKTYRGISNTLYKYNAGLGITTWNKQIDFAQFKKQCTEIEVVKCIKDFLDAENAERKYYDIYNRLRHEVIANRVYQWRNFLSIEDCWNGYQLLVEKLGVSAVVTEMTRSGESNYDEILKRLVAKKPVVRGGKPVKRIGAYYHRIRSGGAEKIAADLLFIWQKLGYEVMLITDEPAAYDDYPVPEGIKRVQIKDFRKSIGKSYGKRGSEWEKIICENELDTIVYHDCTSPVLLWDTCIIKGCGCNLAVMSHSMFAGIMWYDPMRATIMQQIYKMIDGVVALSDTDVAFWQNYCPAYYIPNPIHITPKESVAALDNQNIVWVGRLSPEKQPEDMLQAFAMVKKKVPDATLTMVGSADIDEVAEKLEQMVYDLCIQDSVEFVDFTLDVEKYYRNASVFAFTSMCESFSMVLAESKSYGLPTVMYDLPNLELIKDGKGVVTVAQKDIVKLSEALIKLLNDKELCKKMGQDARQSIEAFAKIDISERWDRVFKGLTQPFEYGEQSMTLVLDILFAQVHKGIQDLRDPKGGQQAMGYGYNANYEEVLNRHEEVVNRHEKSINHQWENQKWHEERICALEQRVQKSLLRRIYHKLFKRK